MARAGLGLGALAQSRQRRLPIPRRLLRLRSDTALAERFAGGDESAFAVLYERHRASVLAVCIGVLGSRHDAEDAAQETFASLAVALRGTPPRELRPWLARVARNAAIDHARRRRVNPSAEPELHERHAVATATDAELETVIAGLRELPESQRTALLMRELAGHSYQEIAGLLETDEEAVRGLIARARIGLRNYREAAELPCATVRAVLAAEADGRRRPKEVRRHLRTCPSCRAYRRSLRADSRALRGIVPVQSGALAGGTAVAGGLATKGVLVGTAMTQLTAACVVSVCAVGGIVLLRTPGRAQLAAPVVRHAVPKATGPAGVAAGAAASIDPSPAGSATETIGTAESAWELVGSAAASNPVGGTRPSSTKIHARVSRYHSGRQGGPGGLEHDPSQQGLGGAGTDSGQTGSAGSGGGGSGSLGQGSATGSAAPARGAGTGTASHVRARGAGSTGATPGAHGGQGGSGKGPSSRAGGSRSAGNGSSSARGRLSSTGKASSTRKSSVSDGSRPRGRSSASASTGSGGVGNACSGHSGSAGGQTGSAGAQHGSAGR